MQIQSIIVALTVAVGLSDARCLITGYDGENCTGLKGQARLITKNARCVEMGNRASYRLEGCNHPRVEKFTGHNCGGTRRVAVDASNRCAPNKERFLSFKVYEV